MMNALFSKQAQQTRAKFKKWAMLACNIAVAPHRQLELFGVLHESVMSDFFHLLTRVTEKFSHLKDTSVYTNTLLMY